ncbi:acetyl-CoA carboxylase, carboxyltransferase subunit beta [Zhaonella formicivorans]|uniref:acetyl-CoA carboxylase, carboxyltransferase subunit beta n=1 Tax=Zhaonella formicivorans TaxID=2528593 RepID=UPI0010E9BF4B|nr:acetyl-CoA carboxylase, carboxyltransferase subunit beta [Zhaonella formicivorans]
MFNPFKKTQYVEVNLANTVSERPFEKCPACKEILIKKELINNAKVCPKCGYHFRLSAWERIEQIVDENTFVELNGDWVSTNLLNFPMYEEKLAEAMQNSKLNEAVVTGEGCIYGKKVIICVMDSNFMMGSMGTVVGEKISQAVERAIELRIPLIIFTASGGARMQEGILSLMQMAKTSALIKKMDREKLLYIAVLTDPTTGGVTASFASLGDIIIAEPNALIGFTGPRVIEQTIGQKLPEGFQKSEFLLEKGFIDLIVHRKELKSKLAELIAMH